MQQKEKISYESHDNKIIMNLTHGRKKVTDHLNQRKSYPVSFFSISLEVACALKQMIVFFLYITHLALI